MNGPSVLAVNLHTGLVEAIGQLAIDMSMKGHPHIVVCRPLSYGAVCDSDLAGQMLRYIVETVQSHKMMLPPLIILAVPSQITEVEKRALTCSAYRARGSEAQLVERGIVAALGAGLAVTNRGGSMIVDLGSGTTEIAVISFGGTVYSRSLRVAGSHMDQAIIDYLQCKYHLLVEETTAEHIKIAIGSAYPRRRRLAMDVAGRDIGRGVTRSITVYDQEVREALDDCLSEIVRAIRIALECTPPELLSDLSDGGIVLTGGGALLSGLEDRVREETGLPVLVADNPLLNVILGMGKLLRYPALCRQITTLQGDSVLAA